MSANDLPTEHFTDDNTPLEEKIFMAMQAYEAITPKVFAEDQLEAASPESQTFLLFNDIVNCIHFPHLPASKDVLTRVNSRLDYRRMYRSALQHLSHYESPRQIAASSSKHILERVEEQFSIQIEDIHDEISTSEQTPRILVKLTLFNGYDRNGDHAGASLAALHQAFMHCQTEQCIELISLDVSNIQADINGQADMNLNAKPHILSTTLNKDYREAKALMNPNSHIFVTY